MENKGEIVKNDRGGKGMGDFAKKILGNRAYGHIVRAFLNESDKRVLDYKHIDALGKHYDISRDYLLYGTMPMFTDEEVSRPVSNIKMSMFSAGNIVYTNVSAMAGSGTGVAASSDEELSTFSIPGVAGSGLYALSVEGTSMEPLLNPGEIIICEQVDGISYIKDNEVCVVHVDGEVWIKYVKPLKDNTGRVSRLKLISENKLEYDPFFVDVNENIRIFRVIRRISEL
ncbi:MAG: S24 family peptidase [Saprospiraceae bacterium]